MEALKNKTGRMAKEITIRRLPSRDDAPKGMTVLEIDGEQFPWYVMDAPKAVAPNRTTLSTLVIEIPAERIVFEDPMP